MAYVYLLSEYEEYGATNVCATLDRSKLEQLLLENFAKGEEDLYMLRNNLQKILADPNVTVLDGKNLSPGWGGPQLHIVELQ